MKIIFHIIIVKSYVVYVEENVKVKKYFIAVNAILEYAWNVKICY